MFLTPPAGSAGHPDSSRSPRLRRLGVSLLAPVGMTATTACHVAAQTPPMQTVVPAIHTNTDANGFGWLPGGDQPLRQQTLIGATHLATLVGRELTALEFRRDASVGSVAGGRCELTVRLSLAQRLPLSCSNVFDANAGAMPVAVFAGVVDLPASTGGGPTSALWSGDNVVRIEFSTPFIYPGGALCVDLVGGPIAGQAPGWWMADQAVEPLTGSAVDLGGGCGVFGGSAHRWAFCAERSLLAGGRAQFFADGPPDGVALAVFGQPAAAGIPLSALGISPLPGCALHLTSADAVVPALFEAVSTPGLPIPATATVELDLPASSAVLGLTLGCQWLECTRMATSNAIAWTIAPALPTLDVALLEGHPLDATGNLSVGRAHVLRFDSH